jgi:uncharacterized integral membrane protein
MNEIQPRYEVSRKDLRKDKALKFGAWMVPVLTAIVPALIFFVLFFFSTATPTAFTFLFLTLASLIGGFLLGLIVTGGILYYRSNWLKKVRERIAVDGIRAEEIDWFKNELTTTEKKSLKEIEVKNLLLADAFRDTLAARLTATRILKSSKQEVLLVERRQNKLKYLKTENSQNLQNELKEDLKKLNQIKSEAEEMRVEAETRLQMIEAANRRGTNLADSELALKKLSARTAELPLALESAKMDDEIRREMEKESDGIEN